VILKLLRGEGLRRDEGLIEQRIDDFIV